MKTYTQTRCHLSGKGIKYSVESLIMISPLSVSTPPPPFFCNTIIALGLVIVRPCGELRNSGPAGRRDKTTHFYSKQAHIEQQNYKMTENARESITIFFTGQIA